MVASFVNSRAKHLYRGIANLLGDSAPSEAFADKLYAQASIRPLMRRPVLGLWVRPDSKPSYIDSGTFLRVALAAALQYADASARVGNLGGCVKRDQSVARRDAHND